jgi:hypothetical protein
MEEQDNLKLNVQQIIVTQGNVQFTEYKKIKQQALQLAAQIESVQVSDENIKQSKKLLAAVNKRLKELEDKRISIKKTMLEPYILFEEQVKEIVSIVKEADSTVRQQVKEMEEAERKEKKDALLSIFIKRKALYTLGDMIPFEDFVQPKHLNKTTSIESVEKEMVEFLEGTERDIKVMKSLPHVTEHVSAYLRSYDLAEAMTQVNYMKERRKQIEASQAKKKTNILIQKTFTVYDEKDFLLVELYMQNNKIKFTVEGGM